MTRQDLDERLVDYLYDELSDAERRRFEAALVDHPDLQAEVAAHLGTRRAMSGLHDEPMPEGLLDGVLREARAAAPGPPEGEGDGGDAPGLLDRLLALVMQPAFAAAMLLVVVAGTGLYLATQQGGGPDGEPAIGEIAVQRPPSLEAERSPRDEASAAEPGVEPEDRLAQGSGVPSAAPPVDEALAEAEAPAEEVALGGAPPAPVATGEPARRPAEESVAQRMEADEVRSRRVAGARPAKAKKATRERAERKAAGKASDDMEQIADALDVKPGTIGRGAGGSGSGAGVPAGAGAQKTAQPEPAPARRERISAPPAESAGEPAPESAPEPPPESAGEAVPESAPEPSEERAREAERPDSDERPAVEGPAPSAWEEVERALAAEPKPERRAEILLSAHDRFVRSGREDLADRALSALEEIPGWEKVARSRRAADAARRAREEVEREHGDDRVEPASRP